MVKPSGKYVANLNPHDKVGYKVKGKFDPKPAVKGDAANEPKARTAPKYKTRKKK